MKGEEVDLYQAVPKNEKLKRQSKLRYFTLSFFYGRNISNIISLFVIQQNDISIEKKVNQCHLLEVSPSSGLAVDHYSICIKNNNNGTVSCINCNEHVQIFIVIIASYSSHISSLYFIFNFAFPRCFPHYIIHPFQL